MEGSPNTWLINSNYQPQHQQHLYPSLFPPPHQFIPSTSSSSSLLLPSLNDHQDLNPTDQSWSQLLLGGLVGQEEDRSGALNYFHHQHPSKIKQDNNWDEEQVFFATSSPTALSIDVNIKQDHHHVSGNRYFYRHGRNEEFQAPRHATSTWRSPIVSNTSSPRSCVTNNMLDFSYNNSSDFSDQHQQTDHSSECNSTSTGVASNKKAKIQPSSNQSSIIKQVVKKEKMSDRITTLHQLVSPFGKTDTASVLLEVIGYIRFLQSQIEALSSPYLGSNGSGNMRHQHSSSGTIIRVLPTDQDDQIQDEQKKDLRTKGLCLVPVNLTLQVGSCDNSTADYWTPTLGGLGL